MRIATFGAGRDFENFLLVKNSNEKVFDDEIVLLVDSDQDKWGRLYGDYIIKSPDQLNKSSFDVVVITSLRYENDIKAVLKENYPQLMYYTIELYCEKKTIDYHYRINLQRNTSDFQKAFHEFDDKSTVVYTAVFGDYDELHDPEFIDPKVDYVCYTDQEDLKSRIWKVRLIKGNSTDRRLLTRRYKLLPHRYLFDYFTSVWMDASMIITGSIIELLHKYQRTSDILLFPHKGTCIYDIAIGEQYREKKERLLRQIFEYYQDGFPIDNGIMCGGFIARNHNQKHVISAMEEWYSHIERYSFRDQISLPYVLWKQHLSYDLVYDYIYNNQYFKVNDHKSLSYVKS